MLSVLVTSCQYVGSTISDSDDETPDGPWHYGCYYKHSSPDVNIHYHLLCKYTQKDDITQT